MVYGGSRSPQTQATKDVSVQGSDDIRQSNARLGIGPEGVVSDVLGAPPVDPSHAGERASGHAGERASGHAGEQASAQPD